jgi:hypothetical protein
MRKLKQLLAEGDPVAREPGMSDDDVRAMRRTILVEAQRRPAATSPWPQPLMLAAALAACLVLGITIGRRVGDHVSPVGVPPAGAPASRDVWRQLQITAPGGTRIIWTFHQELDL